MLPPSLANMTAKEAEMTFGAVGFSTPPDHAAFTAVGSTYKVFGEPSLLFYVDTKALPLGCGFHNAAWIRKVCFLSEISWLKVSLAQVNQLNLLLLNKNSGCWSPV